MFSDSGISGGPDSENRDLSGLGPIKTLPLDKKANQIVRTCYPDVLLLLEFMRDSKDPCQKKSVKS